MERKEIEELKTRKRVTMESIEKVLKFWVKNKDVIGKKLGEYELGELKYTNAYGGCYDWYILKNSDDDLHILGDGYEGVSEGNDYNTYSIPRAGRRTHLDFLHNFPVLLHEVIEKKREEEGKIAEEEKKILRILEKIGKKTGAGDIQAYKFSRTDLEDLKTEEYKGIFFDQFAQIFASIFQIREENIRGCIA